MKKKQYTSPSFSVKAVFEALAILGSAHSEGDSAVTIPDPFSGFEEENW